MQNIADLTAVRLVLPGARQLLQQLWKERKRLLHRAPDQWEYLPFIAGLGGGEPGNFQLQLISPGDAAGATGCAALAGVTRMSSSSSSFKLR